MKALKIAGGLVALVVIALVIFIATFDIGQYKGLIVEQAKAATGREVKIGDIKLGMSLTPTIVISDVSLANASWGSKPEMIVAKRVEARTQLVPLLSGDVRISGVKLEGAEVLLEINREGKPNWVFDVPAASSSSAPPMRLSGVALVGTVLNYSDAVTGQSAHIMLGPTDIQLAGDIRAIEVTGVDLDGAVIDFKDPTRSANIKLSDLVIAAKGPVAAMGVTSVKVGGTKVAYKGAGAPVDLNLTGASLADNGAVDISGDLGGQPVKAVGTIVAPGQLSGAAIKVPVKLDIEVMGLKAETDLVADLSQTPPLLSGTVNMPKLDLSTMPAGQGAEPADGRVFPADPLPWDQLGANNADVKLTVAELILPNGITLTNVAVPVRISAGRLTANGLAADLLGGRVTMDLGLVQASKTVALKLDAKGFTAENLSRQLKVTDLVTQGPLDIAVNVSGRGDSLRAIMASLSGSVIGGMGESRIRNDALNMIGADAIMQVISALNPMGNKDPYTVARCAVVNFQVANGIANTQNGIALVTDKMEVVSTGTINLQTEQLDLAMRPKATSGLAVGLGNVTQAVKLAGPLSEPRVAVDAKGAARALGSLGAAFMTGGVSALAQGQLDKNTGGDPCAAARVWHQGK